MLTVNIGPLALGLDHLLLFCALAIASLVGWRVARRNGDNPESTLFNLFLLGVLVARLAFVIRYWAFYQEDPLQIIDIRDGGFMLWPAIAAVLLGALWKGWRQPRLRAPLGWGLFSGGVFWALTSFASHLYEQNTQLPPISLRDAQGRAVALSDYRGQPLVINLWATWCPPCRREMPVLQRAQQERQDVLFLFVNQGESPHTVSNFLATTGLNLSHVLFDSGGQLGQQVGSMALPTTLFYTPDGRLHGSHLGELSRASLSHALESFERDRATSTAPTRNTP
ncbi:thiol:disulfide interchange protein [Pseudomonas laurentiana]|uniref:prolipoprotein diacylglyceryl transferase family protein n=1 Tax=Pseudomonas laurentiana TaxID=2364649 RepID=UPI00167C25DD|nr:prolipoprotein diacylglyceryl transferase family protein [Pseudomonas laurentiana]GGU84998.1 thiol:disulfide interchange protein [Pseudomonas laurentiana]